MAPMLTVSDLRAGIADNEILRGISLTVNEGEIHAIMGPNGSGKSTFAQVLAGHPAYGPHSAHRRPAHLHTAGNPKSG